MIWLASFPRSGNTFFRNVLYEVYGIESSTYHQDPQRELDENFASYRVVKTHELPSKLPEQYREMPAVYLVRDGRDSLVSIAHHRKDIVAPGTDFYNNLLEAILAQGGSFFGGWSENVRAWTNKAAVVIRFEDLIEDPIREVEKLRAIIDLPQPNPEKLPTFKQLKFGQPQYGAGKKAKGNQTKHFRRGKAGGWRDELSPELEKLLWSIHGPTLLQHGYPASTRVGGGGQSPSHPDLPVRHVMIESSKLFSQDNDGVKRYLVELVRGLQTLLPHLPEWRVELYDRKSVQPLVAPVDESASETVIEEDFKTKDDKEVIKQDRRTMGYEKQLLLLKTTVKRVVPTTVYGWLSDYYKKGPFRSWLNDFKLLARRWKFTKNEEEVFAEVAQADLIHIPLPQHFTEADRVERPLLVTIHDLTHRALPEYHTAANVELAERGLQTFLDRQSDFLAVSQSTKDDLQAAYQLPEERLHLVHEAADPGVFYPRDRKEDIGWLGKKYGFDPRAPYIMCLSTIEPRKNLRNTIRAFIQLKASGLPDQQATTLLICGKKGWKTDDLFAGLDLNRPDIVFTGFVDDVHLPYLYAHARCLCYASFYEGFGLPMLEAMRCKTPVIYGNNSSLPEVAGPGGLPVNPHDANDIEAAMCRILTDEEEWQRLSHAAWQQANTFSWLKTALLTLETYDKIIGR
ncbi:hypothetical protein CEQ90_08945 [Lewinellaceae bacterium SD302]|nr:hypothetical protein CEQ90_08945 [Lewinellaceae bacterium SD302]